MTTSSGWPSSCASTKDPPISVKDFNESRTALASSGAFGGQMRSKAPVDPANDPIVDFNRGTGKHRLPFR